MFLIEANLEEVINDYPIVSDWIDSAKKFIIKNELFDNSKIRVVYLYGFFVNKNSNVDISEMTFDERLTFELSKVRVDVSLYFGKFAMKNRLPNDIIPSVILNLVTELTKVKMILEENDDVNIYNSIPPLNELTSIEVINFSYEEEEEDLDMDDILDKISKNGMDSLTKKEKEFLHNKSKDI